MGYLTIDFSQLTSRGPEISKLLKLLTTDAHGPASQLVPAGTRQYVIGAHDGSVTGRSYRDWRFTTIAPDFRASYFEMWILDEDDFSLYLYRAYMHLYRIERATRTEKEFLALHCDPAEPTGAAHYFYKCGPHLHIMDAVQPIPRAHLALNRGHLDAVLSSVCTLSEAIRQAVLMIREEVLDAVPTD